MLRFRSNTLNNAGVLAVALLWIVGAAGSFAAPESFAESGCDARLQYCVEQQACSIPFRRVAKGVGAAYAFFRELGYTGRHHVDIAFIPEVRVTWGADGDSRIRVMGKYVERERRILLTCWGEPWLYEANDFRIAMTPDFYQTVVTHEMIHFLAARHATTPIDAILSEYVAYSAQIALFPAATIHRLVADNQVTAFRQLEIGEPAYMLQGPAVFGIKSYLHYQATKGSLVRAIVSGSFRRLPDIWLFN